MKLSGEIRQRRFAKSPAEHFLGRLGVSDEQPCEITGEGTLMLPHAGARAHMGWKGGGGHFTNLKSLLVAREKRSLSSNINVPRKISYLPFDSNFWELLISHPHITQICYGKID